MKPAWSVHEPNPRSRLGEYVAAWDARDPVLGEGDWFGMYYRTEGSLDLLTGRSFDQVPPEAQREEVLRDLAKAGFSVDEPNAMAERVIAQLIDFRSLVADLVELPKPAGRPAQRSIGLRFVQTAFIAAVLGNPTFSQARCLREVTNRMNQGVRSGNGLTFHQVDHAVRNVDIRDMPRPGFGPACTLVVVSTEIQRRFMNAVDARKNEGLTRDYLSANFHRQSDL